MSRYLNKGKNGWYRVYALLLIMAGVFLTKKEDFMINIKENEELHVLNHSCAHLLAQAVKHLYPNAKFWVGPVTTEGFYYDIDLGDVTLTNDDLPKIEKEMKKLVKMVRELFVKKYLKKRL